jgi:hypothetical protein
VLRSGSIIALSLLLTTAAYADDDERREQSHQAAIEVAQPRPPEPDIAAPEAPEWRRHLEIGGDFALVLRPLSTAEIDNGTSYSPAPAWGVHVRWSMLSWLRFHAYFFDAHHDIQIPAGALSTPDGDSISPNAVITNATVNTFVFGARLSPTWVITDRFRGWVSAGVGWGRFEFPIMTVTESGQDPFDIRERNAVFVEFPFGVGASYDIIERWLAIEIEVTAAPITGQSGKAHQDVQVTDAEGQIRSVDGFGAIDASIVQSLGLSLIL